jgi:hypothetical protein
MFPTGLRQSPIGGANNFEAVTIPVKNVTASAFVQYGIYQLDLAQGDSDVTTVQLALASAIAVATAGIATGLLCVVQSAIPAGGIGNAVISGVTKIGTIGTTDIAKMDFLKGVNAAASAVKGTAGTDRCHWIALEANATDTVVTNILALMTDCFGRI